MHTERGCTTGPTPPAPPRPRCVFDSQLHDLAGFADHAAYPARSNPALVMSNIAVLMLSAEHDRVCVADDNVRGHVVPVPAARDALLVRTARHHCAVPDGGWPRSWASRLMAGDLMAAADLHHAANTAAHAVSPAPTIAPR